MANQNDLDKVGPRANLREADLSDADLHQVNLRAANLFRAILTNSDLTEANLSHAKLGGADLTGADLAGADLMAAQYDDDTKWPEGFDVGASGAREKSRGFKPQRGQKQRRKW